MLALTPIEPKRVYDSRPGEPVWDNPDTIKGILKNGDTREVWIGYEWAGLSLVAVSSGAGFLSASGSIGGNATSIVNFDSDGVESGSIILSLPSKSIYVTAKGADAHFVVDISVVGQDVVPQLDAYILDWIKNGKLVS